MSERVMCIPTDLAFPDPGGDYDGLTKREYFAAMAMQAYIGFNAGCEAFDCAGAEAVKYADALIAALNKWGEE